MAKPKVVFMEAEREVYDLMAAVIEERFPEIAGCEPPLKIAVLMAGNGGEKWSPCLKHHGAACAAMIKKTNPEERADEAAPDVRILIDRNRWDERKERGRAAILAHELRHVAFKKDKNDEQKFDEYGRPVIGFVPDDWTLTGFYDVAEWYGKDAVEVECVRRVQGTLVQLGLPFDGEAVTIPVSNGKKRGHRQDAALSASAAV